ncbi:MAG TPA: SusC/RagA family TonB-linked outer membrane protein [Gemmatimonadaceae bacterium]|nr:SusC/RagA family TonB-linked outer membrane protein [Gemmatimonadaceae bacterium]
MPGLAWAQEAVTITGRVTGEGGGALSSANVTVPSLNILVYVNPDGTYRIVVPAARAQGQTVSLMARMIGHRSQGASVTLTPGTTVERSFQLPTDPLRLEEVVVTGAGTQSLAERLGTARSNVDAVTLQRANEPNVVQALVGKSPNVLTNQASGDAGSSTAIQIRGAKTFGTSQPLIIVDGVPTNNNTRAVGTTILQGPPQGNRAQDINPEDIENIEILKGAAATSIYGASAGSAGAILITTKRGKAGRTQYTLRSSFQSDKALRTIPTQRTYGVGANGLSTACTTVNCTIASGFFSWGPALAAGTPTFDHSAEIYETGNIWDNTLSASGGNERTTFYVSAGHLNHDGFIVQDRDVFKRSSVRFNGAHSLFENFTVGASGSYVQTKGSGHDRGNALNGIGLGALRQPPEFNAQQYLDPVSGLHRSWRFPNPGPTAFTTSRGFDNPFYAINEDQLSAEAGRYYGNINMNWRPFSRLSVNYVLGGDYTSDDRTTAFARSSSGTAGGSLERWQFYDRIIDHNLSATASWQMNSNVMGNLTVGQNLSETYFRQVQVTGQTFIAPKPFKLANTVTRTIPLDSEQRRRIEGYFGQLGVDLFDQVFLQARLRNDGNSALGEGHQRATYPGASAAWSFSKALSIPERFLSFGKLRIAYGESGQQPPLYALQDLFVTTLFADFNPASLQAPTLNGIGGLYASATRGNPEIGPERVKETEAGFDLGLFSGRSDFSLTYYNSRSSDVVFGASLPPSTGYTAVNLNAGELSNKGWEITSSFRPVQRPDFSMELGANWGRNRNEVLSLGAITSQLDGTIPMPTAANCKPEAVVPRCESGIGSSFAGQATFLQVGYPLGVWRSNDFARCGRGLTTVSFGGSSHDVGAACAGAPNGALYIAANGFPITDPNVRAIGNPWPDWTGGISAYVQVRGIELSAFLDHRQGGNVLNMTRASMYQYGTHKDTEIRGQTRTFGQDMLCHNITCDVLNGPVVGPGAGTAVVIGEGWFNAGALGNGQGATGGPITQRLEDATNTRLREISIGYSFKSPWVQRLAGTQQLDLKLSGRNLKLWTDYSGFDPETNLGGAANSNRGIDWFNAPLARAFVVSVAFHH